MILIYEQNFSYLAKQMLWGLTDIFLVPLTYDLLRSTA